MNVIYIHVQPQFYEQNVKQAVSMIKVLFIAFASPSKFINLKKRETTQREWGREKERGLSHLRLCMAV